CTRGLRRCGPWVLAALSLCRIRGVGLGALVRARVWILILVVGLAGLRSALGARDLFTASRRRTSGRRGRGARGRRRVGVGPRVGALRDRLRRGAGLVRSVCRLAALIRPRCVGLARAGGAGLGRCTLFAGVILPVELLKPAFEVRYLLRRGFLLVLIAGLLVFRGLDPSGVLLVDLRLVAGRGPLGGLVLLAGIGLFL